MTIRMSGMVSGMDTESLVSAMVSTYVSKKEKISESPDQVVLQAGCMEGFEYQSI